MLKGPHAPPRNFTVGIITSRVLLFSWSPPAEENRNGVITGYTLTCEPDIDAIPAVFVTEGNHTVGGFTPATQYNCSVYASTNGGDGPPAVTLITTPEDGWYNNYFKYLRVY